ncbi:Initiation-control protein YabA [Pediococcus pentosaceus]|uniref:Initiation-control protein YabA n=1 Tax=Pediococcus pentosaceus TaxID=1255 RepID=A0A1Y0VTH2_PEDPE|nr:Initiation-control protein YabA [Pediococcus pentosaceus]
MDKKDLFDQITEVTRNTEDLLNKLHETQSAMVEIMEENAELQIENQHLRERLKQATAAESEGTKNTKYGLSKSLQNLENYMRADITFVMNFTVSIVKMKKSAHFV